MLKWDLTLCVPFLPYIKPNSSYGNFCSFGTTSLANLSSGSSYPQSNCPTDTSTKGLIFKISIILAIASLKNRAACLLCDVALNIGIFGTITTSSSEPPEFSSSNSYVLL